MAANVTRFGPALGSERVLAGLAARIGRHGAQQALHEILRGDGADAPVSAAPRSARRSTRPGADAGPIGGRAGRARAGHRGRGARLGRAGPAVAAAGAMVDAVLARLGP